MSSFLTVDNPHITYTGPSLSAVPTFARLHICGFIQPWLMQSCSRNYGKKLLRVSGPWQFKPTLFKNQLYFHFFAHLRPEWPCPLGHWYCSLCKTLSSSYLPTASLLYSEQPWWLVYNSTTALTHGTLGSSCLSI